MTKYRKHLPQLDGKLFLTDGGLETSLIFHDGVDLPYFASFILMKDEAGRRRLNDYYERYVGIAAEAGRGLILESPTWRASADWGDKLGYDRAALAGANRSAVALLVALRNRRETAEVSIVVSGCVGPRGDGYDPGRIMTAEEAEAYHAEQVGALAEGGADMIGAITMTNVPEAIGVTRAAARAGLPVAVSFTVETDGRLPTGQSLQEAVEAVEAATGGAPAYYMINCAHPTHFADTLEEGAAWVSRLRGLRANASKRSHAELDASTDLDDGDPVELGGEYRDLLRRHPQVTIVGGCCGTDHRHIEQISWACRDAA